MDPSLEPMIQTAAAIVLASAIEYMANAEGITEADVMALLQAGHPGALRHFQTFAVAGAEEAARVCYQLASD